MGHVFCKSPEFGTLRTARFSQDMSNRPVSFDRKLSWVVGCVGGWVGCWVVGWLLGWLAGCLVAWLLGHI